MRTQLLIVVPMSYSVRNVRSPHGGMTGAMPIHVCCAVTFLSLWFYLHITVSWHREFKDK